MHVSFIRRFWPVLLLALVPLLPLWRTVFIGEGIGPFDQIRQMAPWSGHKPAQPWDVLQADGVLQFFPWRSMVFEAWGKGQLPAWNPYELAGTPLLANSQSAALYPPHMLVGLVHIPVVPAMTFLAWFHLFWVGLGLYWLVRRLGGTEIGGVVAGSSFSLSSFMLAWTALPSVISTVAWIPWVLWGVAGLFCGDSSRLKGVALLALAVGMMLLAGHLQFAAYGLMAAAILAIWFAVRPPESGRKADVRGLAACVAAVVLGGMLAAPQLLPVLSYSKFSHRQNTPTEAGYSDYTGLSLSPAEVLARSVNPMAEGDPTVFEPEGVVSTFWPAIAKPGANFAESAASVGPLVFLLTLVAILCRIRIRTVAPLLAVSAVGVLLACGSWFNRVLYFGVPGWSSTGSPNRSIVLFVMGLCAVAGLALGEAVSDQKKKLIGLAGVLLVLCIAGGALGANAAEPKWATFANQAFSASFIPLLIAVVLALAAYGLTLVSSDVRLGVLLVIAPCAIAALIYAPRLVRTGAPLSKISLPLATGQRIATINSSWDFVQAAPAILPPNTAAILRVHELGGYDSLLHKSTVDMLKEVNGGERAVRRGDPAPLANGNMMFIKPGVDLGKLAEAGVSHLISSRPVQGLGPGRAMDGPADEGESESDRRPKFVAYDVPGPGRAYTPAGPAKIVSESYRDIELTAIGPGKLNLKDRNMPGWTATVDGKDAVIEGDVWREVDLPAGAHTVRFSYTPPGLMVGLLLGLPGWLLVGVLAWIRPRKTAGKEASVAPERVVA